MSQGTFPSLCDNPDRFGTEKATKNLENPWFWSDFAIVIYLGNWTFFTKNRNSQIEASFVWRHRHLQRALYFICVDYRSIKSVCIKRLFLNRFENYFQSPFWSWLFGKSTNLLKDLMFSIVNWSSQIQLALRPEQVLLGGANNPETLQIVFVCSNGPLGVFVLRILF